MHYKCRILFCPAQKSNPALFVKYSQNLIPHNSIKESHPGNTKTSGCQKDTALRPTLIEESSGRTYWFIKNISAIPTTARIKKLITADTALFCKTIPLFLKSDISYSHLHGIIHMKYIPVRITVLTEIPLQTKKSSGP